MDNSELINAAVFDDFLEQISFYDKAFGHPDRKYTIAEFRKMLKQQQRYKSDNIPNGYWMQVDNDEPMAYDCSICGRMFKKKYLFCPICKTLMDNASCEVMS